MPKGKGNRISKPATARQRENAASHDRPHFIPDSAGLPSESWWLKPGAFQQQEAEQERMKSSRFGRAQTPTLLEP